MSHATSGTFAKHLERLKNNANQCGFKIRRDVPPDGDCLYSCISDQMQRLQLTTSFISAQEWRDRLFTFLQKLVRF